jgi:hypothetical protein
MNKKILLIALVLCLVAGGNLLAANLLLNPGFEDTNGVLGSFSGPTTTIIHWTKSGVNGWYHADAGKVIGLRAIKAWMADSNVYQDFSAAAGEVYNVGAKAYAWSGDNFGLRGMNGVVAVQWLNSAKTTVISTDIIGYFYGAQTVGVPIDPYDTWKSISGMAAAPTGASYGRVRLYLQNAVGTLGGSLNWDDASVEQNLYPASNPSPTNGSTVDTASPVTLSWTRPAPRIPGDTITCDVYFGTDPNLTLPGDKIVTKQAISSKLVGMLAPNTNYYWRVDCYDPDGSGPEIKTEGMKWTFTTQNQAPVVDAGKKQVVWMASGTATAVMDATVSDDGFPLPPALTYTWTKISGAGTPVFSPSNTVKNPTVTFTVADSNYVLRLRVSDGAKDACDTVKVRVYAQGDTGIVAYYKLDETTGSTAADSSGNGNDGTVLGTPVWTTGQKNGAIELSGDTGNFINCGEAWADFTEEITVSAWIKCTFDQPWQAIVTKGDSSWRLFRDCVSGDSNNASFTLNGTGFTPAVSGSTGGVSDNKWHQIVGTYDGFNQCIYVDGILAASHVIPEGTLIATNDWNVCIGADDEHEGERLFDGLIDEVRIYEIGLPADMVLDQFIADGGHDSCGGNYLPGDLNKDCYITFADFAEFANSWLDCTDVTNSRCE